MYKESMEEELLSPEGLKEELKTAGLIGVDITIEEYTTQMNCNFLASLLLIQHCAGYMQERKWGRIVTIGSVQELKPHPDMLVYSSSKCAQAGMARSLASQLAGYGITVNNVAPGVIYTDRNKEAFADEEYAKSVRKSIPLGYYGEKLVLLAQTLGLNTCWVAMTFSKRATKGKCVIKKGEKLVCVLALGYGTNQGITHKIKDIKDVCKDETNMPDWYKRGIEAALLAPTAMNQQKFEFSREDNVVSVKATGGFYSKVDLGIVKYHFEVGAKKDNFTWK